MDVGLTAAWVPITLVMSQEGQPLCICFCLLPCPPPGDLPNPGIEPRFPALQADSLPSEPPRKPVLKANPSLFLSVSAFPSIVFYTWQSLHILNMLSLKENHFLQILSPLLIFVTLTHFSFSLRPSLPLFMHTHR